MVGAFAFLELTSVPDQPPRIYVTRASGLVVPAAPPERRPRLLGPVETREFASLDEIDAFLDGPSKEHDN